MRITPRRDCTAKSSEKNIDIIFSLVRKWSSLDLATCAANKQTDKRKGSKQTTIHATEHQHVTGSREIIPGTLKKREQTGAGLLQSKSLKEKILTNACSPTAAMMLMVTEGLGSASFNFGISAFWDDKKAHIRMQKNVLTFQLLNEVRNCLSCMARN